jgi:hypothetical protein
MPVAHQPSAAILGPLAGIAVEQGRDLGLDGCASSAHAPSRKTPVNGSAKVPGWQNWKR